MKCKYDLANSKMQLGEYDLAIEEFTLLGDYLNSKELILLCRYNKAISLFDKGNYEESFALFEELGDYEEAALYAKKANDLKDPYAAFAREAESRNYYNKEYGCIAIIDQKAANSFQFLTLQDDGIAFCDMTTPYYSFGFEYEYTVVWMPYMSTCVFTLDYLDPNENQYSYCSGQESTDGNVISCQDRINGIAKMKEKERNELVEEFYSEGIKMLDKYITQFGLAFDADYLINF
jgi:hypothetical protein